jgi:hypothetical protein
MRRFAELAIWSLTLEFIVGGISNAAPDASGRREAKIVWSLDHQGLGKFCYDRNPEIIYFKYDQSTNTTSMRSASLDGNKRVVARFTGPPDERSLSCSDDGATIAAFNADQTAIYIVRSGRLSAYAFDRPLLYSVHGLHSLLGGSGKIIALPSMPHHFYGPDIINDFTLFIQKDAETAYIVNNTVYANDGNHIFAYDLIDQTWVKRNAATLSTGFGVNEISECDGHIIVSSSNDEIAKYYVLGPSDRDWINKIGITKLLRTFSNAVDITGGYEHCSFPLISRADIIRHIVVAIAVVGRDNVEIFSIPPPVTSMSGNEIRLTKDGCYALLNAFKQAPDVPQFTLPKELMVLRLGSPACG